MTAAALFLVAIGALAGSAVLLRRMGPSWRVGRLLAVAPLATLDEVIALARTDDARYVRTHGRISSDDEFPDENQRPLVYRRRRLQQRVGSGPWRDLDDERLAVPFGVEDRQAFVAVDVEALGDGLVVVPREAEGAASELPDDLRTRLSRLAPDARVRLRIEQVSAVEHATAAGVPVLDAGGAPMLTAGLGRPLVLTTLDDAAAMRVLGAGHRRGVLAVVALLIGGLAALALAPVALLLGW